MRGVYLTPHHFEGGCRGGVASLYDCGGTQDYELEIDGNANASPEMMSLCAHYDEIIEFLKDGKSLLGQMLYRSILQVAKDLKES